MAFSMGKDITFAQNLFEEAVKTHTANTVLIGA
jgi:CarD family transcriptional regulator